MINGWWSVQQCWIKASSHKRWWHITTFNNTCDHIVWCYRAATVYHSIRTVWSATICYRQLWFLWHVWKQTQTRYNHAKHFIKCDAIHNKQLPRLTTYQKFISCHTLQKCFPPLPSLWFLLSLMTEIMKTNTELWKLTVIFKDTLTFVLSTRITEDTVTKGGRGKGRTIKITIWA